MTVHVGWIDRTTGALRWQEPLVSWRTEVKVGQLLACLMAVCEALASLREVVRPEGVRSR